ncbi:MAG: methylenetetrahydrofolate reductase [Verrucomicrobiota bacterium]
MTLFQNLVDEVFITLIPGSDPLKTIPAIKQVHEAGFLAVPHVTARGFQSLAQLNDFFSATRELGVQKALILAGGLGQPAGPFTESLDLLKTESLQNAGLQTIAFAGHPEGNPEDPESWANLLQKKAFLDETKLNMEIVTQWSFSPDAVSNYISRLRSQGIQAPVKAGIAGPSSLKTLLKYAKTCGVTAAKEVLRKQGFNLGRLLMSNNPQETVRSIQGTPHFHLYPFGGLQKSAKWLQEQRQSLAA